MLKILHPVDGSENALRATGKLVESLTWYAEPPRIVLMAVHLPVPRYPNMNLVISEEMIDRYYKDELDSMLEPSRKILDGANTAYDVCTRIGGIAESIVGQAHDAGSDLIVMGTRGMGALAGVVMGSVATRVLHLATTPVLLVP